MDLFIDLLSRVIVAYVSVLVNDWFTTISLLRIGLQL
jgi:hypothetical protein